MKHTILFLAANPRDTNRLALDEECAAIERELRMTAGRDDFEFRSKWAVTVDELMRHLNEHAPTILHFSGHGGAALEAEQAEHDDRHHGSARDVATSYASGGDDVDGGGIFLEHEHEQASQYVSGRALAKIIASAAPATRVVVLNACYSAAIAESLCNVVGCVIGVRGAIADGSARSLAVAFYRALGNRRSVGNAVAQTIATLVAKQQHQAPIVCKTRDGVSVDDVFLSVS